MKRLLLLALLVFPFASAFAQNTQKFSVESFRLLPTDMTASSREWKHIDQNGATAALIKIVTSETGFAFDGGTLSVLDSKQMVGEIWVWVPYGSRKITISHQQLGVLREYRYPVEIEAERTYEMVLTTAKIETIVKEEVRQQYLAFKVTPPNATLEVNDDIWEVDADGNAQNYVNFGTYSWRVQAPNYHADAGNVTVNDPNNTQFVTVTLLPNFGWIEVDGKGNLQGASVYIDNTMAGKAPFKSEALKSGQHSVRIVKKMYVTYSETVTVSDNQITRLSPTLTSDFAEVTLKVDADAEIWVNNEKKSVRTWTGPLGSGTYKIECKQAGHETSLTTKEITASMNGQTIVLTPPTPIYGALMVESTPKFCKLYIDGKDIGTTPKSINELLIGQHEIRLTQDGYADYRETVTVTKGERKQVKAELSKKTEMANNQPVVMPSATKEDALSGVFSVGIGKKVYFSRGNLQYQASTNTWRFAEHQWDVIGEANKNISSTYSGWIDLFGWGTSGWNSSAVCYQPWSTSTSFFDYYPGGSYTNNLTGSYANADWGVYNRISNVGNTANTWRTLTVDEWEYAFNTRTTSSGIRYAKACVNSVNGVILLPDDWSTSTYSLSNTNSSGANYTANTITATQWVKLEAAGAVFLPAAGYRNGTSVINVGSYGNYWSASYNGSYYAYYVYFNDSNLDPQNYNGRYYGQSVRLVRSAQ